MCSGGSFGFGDGATSGEEDNGIPRTGTEFMREFGRAGPLRNLIQDPYGSGGSNSSQDRNDTESNRTRNVAIGLGTMMGIAGIVTLAGAGGGGAAAAGGGVAPVTSSPATVPAAAGGGWGTAAGLVVAGSQIYQGQQQQQALNEQAGALEDQARAFERQQIRQAQSLTNRANVEDNRASRRAGDLRNQGQQLKNQYINRAILDRSQNYNDLDKSIRVSNSEVRRGQLASKEAIRAADLMIRQAEDMEAEANIDMETAQIKDSLFRIQAAKTLSSARVAISKGGVILDNGSPLETMAEITRLTELESRINVRDAQIVARRKQKSAEKTRISSFNLLTKGAEQEEESRITAQDVLDLGAAGFLTAGISVQNIMQSGIDAEEQNARQANEAITAAKEASEALRLEAEDVKLSGRDAVETGLFNAQSARDSGTAAMTAGSVNALSTILTTQGNR